MPPNSTRSHPLSHSTEHHTLNFPLLYIISLSSIVAVCLFVVWRLSLSDYQNRLIWLRKVLLYSTVARRRRGTSSVSFLTAIGILTLITANIFLMRFRVHNTLDLATRASKLSLSNMSILLYGAGGNVLVNYVLKVGLGNWGILHRWLGRICLLQALIHSLCRLSLLKARLNSLQITVSFLPSCQVSNLMDIAAHHHFCYIVLVFYPL
jgi:hypothetical protein